MKRNRIIFTMLTILILSLGLAWISSGFESVQGWGSFLAVLILGAGILLGGWQALKTESVPPWLGWLVLGAAALRLTVGVFWFIALPRFGHGTEVELAGYVMADAHSRDTVAWELSQSDAPLWTAFQDYRLADQYGGLLFFSAGVYRFLGGDVHQPLMIVVLTSAFSAMSVLFTWAFTSRLWGKQTAKIAAWILALFPDAVLLGSSQMREAFAMTLAAIAVYGLIYAWQERQWNGLGWAVGALLLSVPLSSMYAILLIGVLGVFALALDQFRVFRNWQLWAVLGFMAVIVLAGIWFLGDRIFPDGAANPWELIQQWFKYAAKWEVYTAERSSGWIQKIFRLSPQWAHSWILLSYGVVQPFLPASLVAVGIWLWRGIAIWRALGWALLLVLLMYALFRSAREVRKNLMPFGFSLMVWIIIIISAYRGGGDQWDNPRYRTAFVVLQAAAAAWVWGKQQRNPDPWLRRIVMGAGLVFAWFIPWYVRRYIPEITWAVVDLFKTAALGGVSAVLFWVWDWARVNEKQTVL